MIQFNSMQRPICPSQGGGGGRWGCDSIVCHLSYLTQQQQHQKLYVHDHKGITVLQKLLI